MAGTAEAGTAGGAGARPAGGAGRAAREVRYVRRRAPLALRALCVALSAAVSAAVTALAALAVARALGQMPYAVVSGSMEPEIPTGSLVLADTNVAYGEGLVGSVIAFRSAGAVVVHRAVEAAGEGLVTQGDANDAPDGTPVREADYIGAVRLYVPRAGVAAMALSAPEGAAGVALLALAALALRVAARRWARAEVVRTVLYDAEGRRLEGAPPAGAR